MFSKKKLLILLILAAGTILIIGIVIKNNFVYPQNQFGITEKDSFCLSHSYNVNGVVGYEKTKFTSRDKQKVLNFIASLDNEEVLKVEIEPSEETYGIPEMLTISKKDSVIVFYLYSMSNIEFEKSDKNGNVVSRKRYTITEKQLKNMYILLGLKDKEPF